MYVGKKENGDGWSESVGLVGVERKGWRCRFWGEWKFFCEGFCVEWRDWAFDEVIFLA